MKSRRRVNSNVRRPAVSRCGREWLDVGECVAGWIEARQATRWFFRLFRKNDGHDIDDEISMSNPAAPSTPSDTSSRRFYHGTRADLKPGDLLQPGNSSNYTERRSPWIYFSETVFAATWGAELAKREGPGRIYVVEPTGSFMDDPNVMDRKYPGNPTKSYRSRSCCRSCANTWIGGDTPRRKSRQ